MALTQVGCREPGEGYTFCTPGSYADGREEESMGKVIRAIGPRRRDELVLFNP